MKKILSVTQGRTWLTLHIAIRRTHYQNNFCRYELIEGDITESNHERENLQIGNIT